MMRTMGRFNRGVLLLMVVSLCLVGCTSSKPNPRDPKKQLSDYISQSFAVRSEEDRNTMLSYLTGNAKQRLAAWSAEQFREAFIETKRQFVRLVIQDSRVSSESEINITYELTYLDQGKGHDARITQRKMARMVDEQGRWLVAEVRNLRELVEYKDDFTLP